METIFACTLSDPDAGFQRLMEDAEAFLAEHDVPVAVLSPMMVALDEVISNIFSHGVREGEPTVEVTLSVEAEAGRDRGARIVRAMIEDDGIAFDPLQRPDPDISLSSDDRPIGGLGIFLVRQMMDAVRYDRNHDRNRLSFYKAFAGKELESD